MFSVLSYMISYVLSYNDIICDVICHCDIIYHVQAQSTKTFAGHHNSGAYHHFTGKKRLDVHLLKPSRLEVVQEQLQDAMCDADIAESMQTRRGGSSASIVLPSVILDVGI